MCHHGVYRENLTVCIFILFVLSQHTYIHIYIHTYIHIRVRVRVLTFAFV